MCLNLWLQHWLWRDNTLLFWSLRGRCGLLYPFINGFKGFFVCLMMLPGNSITLLIHLEIILGCLFIVASLNFFEHFVDELFLFLGLIKGSFYHGGIDRMMNVNVIEYIRIDSCAIMTMISGVVECPHHCFINLYWLDGLLLFRCFGERFFL